MYLTTAEALAVLESIGNRTREAYESARRLESLRDDVLVALDGQEGCSRTRMAEALGLARSRVHTIIRDRSAAPERESIEEGVEWPDALSQAVREVVESVHGPIRGALAVDALRESPDLTVRG